MITEMKTNRPLRAFVRLTLAIALLTAVATDCYAQNLHKEYFARNGVMYYHNEPMRGVDFRSFIELGFGYAKDRFNVYYQGMILEYVDPFTFQLKQPEYGSDGTYHPYDRMYPMEGYQITSNAVLYNGRKIKQASASSFKVLEDGYAVDAFEAYYLGMVIKGASSSSFKYIGEGYAKDAFSVYYLGKEIKGASSSSFKILGNGYAEDTFETYYLGRKID